MADYLPKFNGGAVVTFTATAAITGGQVVAVNGVRSVAPAGADSGAIAGVAARDAKTGEQVAVFVGGGVVHKVVASAEITAGAKVTSATGGKVAPIGAGVNLFGIALTAAGADAVVEVLV